MAKVITGIRRCGKSYLLNTLYREWLHTQGVSGSQILSLELDDIRNSHLREAHQLYDYLISQISSNETYYVFLDEIQLVENFTEVVNSLLHIKNLDVYVTGSNSKFLSSDILTEFRGRGDEIRVRPLTFSEYHSAHEISAEDDWQNYVTFGGMPQVALMNEDELKIDYLSSLYRKVYLLDIEERNQIRHSQTLETLVEVLASSVGSLTSFKKIADTFNSKTNDKVSDKTIKRYTDLLEDAFMFEQAKRFDVKGRKYIGGNVKYYAEDIGVRNAVLNFRQQEENHLLENIVYLELKTRGYNVDVGQISINEKINGDWKRKNCEIDFVATKGNEKLYIQCALSVADSKKRLQEERPFTDVKDSFEKVLIVRDRVKPWRDELGVLTISAIDFLLS